jgi:hypothetical protein
MAELEFLLLRGRDWPDVGANRPGKNWMEDTCLITNPRGERHASACRDRHRTCFGRPGCASSTSEWSQQLGAERLDALRDTLYDLAVWLGKVAPA